MGFEDLHRSGIISDQQYYKEQANLQKTLGTNMSTVAREGVFRQDSDAMSKTLFPFLRDINNAKENADINLAKKEASTDFYNSVQKKILNNDRGKIMNYFENLNRPLTELDYDRTINQLNGLWEEFVDILNDSKLYERDDPNFKESSRFIQYQVDQQERAILNSLYKVSKEKLQFLNEGSMFDPFSKGKRWRVLQHNIKDTGLEVLDLASNIERMSDQWDNMSGFEKFKTIASFLTDTAYTVRNLVQAWQEYTRIAEEVDLLTKWTTVSQAALGTTQTTTAAEEVSANAAKIASNQALTASYSEAAAAGYMAAHSAIPFVGYGIGAGFTASSIATIKSAGVVGMFADGGIITGAGSGWSDSIPTLLSNGEMVLNRRQQGNLFALLDGSRVSDSAPSGGVEFKIKGTELVGVLKNYNKKTSKTL